MFNWFYFLLKITHHAVIFQTFLVAGALALTLCICTPSANAMMLREIEPSDEWMDYADMVALYDPEMQPHFKRGPFLPRLGKRTRAFQARLGKRSFPVYNMKGLVKTRQ